MPRIAAESLPEHRSQLRQRIFEAFAELMSERAFEAITMAQIAHWAPGESIEVDSPAADAYRERLLAAGSWGGLLVAHHYTRYLGDLSGGQAIGRILDRAFELDGHGIAFYAFPAVPKPKPYKDAYRARLDALGLGADDQQRVVEEVKVAFGLNQALFEELGHAIDAYRR